MAAFTIKPKDVLSFRVIETDDGLKTRGVYLRNCLRHTSYLQGRMTKREFCEKITNYWGWHDGNMESVPHTGASNE